MVGRQRETYTPGEAYLVDGAVLNEYSTALNAPARNSSYTDGSHKHVGAIVQQDIAPPPFIFGVAVILPTGTACTTGSDPRDGTIPPCDTENLYNCRFRWYHHADAEWKEYEETVRLDAAIYWEGREDDSLPRGQYESFASKSPTSGPGYGAIPVFKEGDMVPAYWDDQRGWAVAVQTVPQDTVRGQFISNTPQTVSSQGSMETVSVYLERITPTSGGYGSWVAFAEAHFRTRNTLSGDDWYDTRSGFGYFSTPQVDSRNSSIRMRIVNRSGYDIVVNRTAITLYGAGRLRSDNTVNNTQIFAPSGGTAKTNWVEETSVAGRFKDAPIFTVESTAGNLKDQLGINYLDRLDDWIIGCEFHVNISPSEDSGFSSSSTSSLSSSSASSSQSTSSSSLSPSSQSTSSSSISTSSASSSSELMSSSLSTSTLGSDEDINWTCITVVTGVICNPDGTVDEVCYTTICYPIPEGFTAGPSEGGARGVEFCVPCETIADMSSDSSSSSLSTSSSELANSSSSELTGSSDSSVLEEDGCPGWELDEDPYILDWMDYAGDHDEDPVTLNAIVALNATSQANWQQALDDHQVTFRVISKTGTGDVTFNDETGEVTYTPPDDGSEGGTTQVVVVELCEDEDQGTSSSSSSVTSSSSSSSSTSSSLGSSSSTSSSSSSSVSSSSWSSVSQSQPCDGFELNSPQTAETASSTSAIELQVLGGGGVNWDEAVNNGTVELTIVSSTSSCFAGVPQGVFDIHNDRAVVTYTPPGDGSEAGCVITLVVRACDYADETCCAEATINLTINAS